MKSFKIATWVAVILASTYTSSANAADKLTREDFALIEVRKLKTEVEELKARVEKLESGKAEMSKLVNSVSRKVAEAVAPAATSATPTFASPGAGWTWSPERQGWVGQPVSVSAPSAGAAACTTAGCPTATRYVQSQPQQTFRRVYAAPATNCPNGQCPH